MTDFSGSKRFFYVTIQREGAAAKLVRFYSSKAVAQDKLIAIRNENAGANVLMTDVEPANVREFAMLG